MRRPRSNQGSQHGTRRPVRGQRHHPVPAGPLVGLLAGLAGCVTSAGCCSTHSMRHARVHHMVLFSLEDPDRAGLLAAESLFMAKSIDGVANTFAGPPSATKRPMTDDDYDVAFYVGFENDTEYQAYLEHPAHRAIVERWRGEIAEMRVIDVGGR